MAGVSPRFQQHCAKAQNAQGIQAGGCRCIYPWWKEEGKVLQGKRIVCAQSHQMNSKTNNQWLVSAMIEWIISQSLLTREGADSIQAERQQHPAVRCPPFTDRGKCMLCPNRQQSTTYTASPVFFKWNVNMFTILALFIP